MAIDRPTVDPADTKRKQCHVMSWNGQVIPRVGWADQINNQINTHHFQSFQQICVVCVQHLVRTSRKQSPPASTSCLVAISWEMLYESIKIGEEPHTSTTTVKSSWYCREYYYHWSGEALYIETILWSTGIYNTSCTPCITVTWELWSLASSAARDPKMCGKKDCIPLSTTKRLFLVPTWRAEYV